jgi:hypothetical protein
MMNETCKKFPKSSTEERLWAYISVWDSFVSHPHRARSHGREATDRDSEHLKAGLKVWSMATSSYHAAQAGFYTFAVFAAAISSLLSFIAALVNYFYSKNKASRYHTLVTLLILCDGFGSLCFVVWAGVDEVIVGHEDDSICQLFLPFPTYFFLLSFCWTSLIAHRFQRICEVNNSKLMVDFPLWPFPLLCLILVLPIVSLNASGVVVSETVSAVSAEGLDFCFFASTNTAFAANLLTFQLPCVFTVLYNLKCFHFGIVALRLSPERVGPHSPLSLTLSLSLRSW